MLQVPWRALGSQPVVVRLCDVLVVAGPRSEAEWEEGPATARRLAASQAAAAAVALESISKRATQVWELVR